MTISGAGEHRASLRGNPPDPTKRRWIESARGRDVIRRQIHQHLRDPSPQQNKLHVCPGPTPEDNDRSRSNLRRGESHRNLETGVSGDGAVQVIGFQAVRGCADGAVASQDGLFGGLKPRSRVRFLLRRSVAYGVTIAELSVSVDGVTNCT